MRSVLRTEHDREIAPLPPAGGVMGNPEAYANQEAISAAFPIANVSKVKTGGKGEKRQRMEVK